MSVGSCIAHANHSPEKNHFEQLYAVMHPTKQAKKM